jgi:hypothetical protein
MRSSRRAKLEDWLIVTLLIALTLGGAIILLLDLVAWAATS